MRRMRDLGVRGKLLCSYLTVYLIAVGLILWLAVASSGQNVYENNLRTVEGIVDKACDNFERKAEQFESVADMFVYNSDLQEIYRNRFPRVYELYVRLKDSLRPFVETVNSAYSREIRSLCIYSTTGLQRWRNNIRSADGVQAEEWFAEAYISGGKHWRMDTDGLSLTSRIDYLSTWNAESLGVFRLVLNTDAIFGDYVYIAWPDYRMELRDSTGKILFSHVQGEYAETEACEEVAHPLTVSDWQLVFRIPQRTLRTTGYSVKSLYMIVVALGLGILLLVIALFTRHMLVGVDSLKKSMERFNEGDLSIEIAPPKTNDEIGMLTKTFAGMLMTIRELLDKAREDGKRMNDMENRLLRAQIDPHFLYNTLSYINWKCLRAGQEDVSEIVSQLASFYRTCLNKGSSLTHVRTEITNIRAYIAIQQKLHDDSFSAIFEIPEELGECLMPSFVLQPLVENAIRHGIDRKRDGGGLLVISLRQEEELLAFRIRDNGPGLAQGAEERSDSDDRRKSGYGLRNVKERVLLACGEGSRLTVQNCGEGGCESVLRIPIVKKNAE